jgi:hypothetical protein
MSPFSLPNKGQRASLLHAALAIGLSLVGAVAGAQAQPKRSPVPDPADPAAQVPAIAHTSSLARYRRLQEGAGTTWPEANAQVQRIGGWRAYARETAPPDQAQPALADPARSTQPQGHGHHKHHGKHSQR